MSILDQYPQMQDRKLPTWLDDETESNDDLVSAARKALAESLRRLDPESALPSLVDIRLSGQGIDGSIPAEMTSLVKRFQSEIEAAMTISAVERGDAVIELAGVSSGSVVLHMKPKIAGLAADHLFPAIELDVFDEAVGRVMSIHDSFERLGAGAQDSDGALQPDGALSHASAKLLDAVQAMVIDLNSFNVDLEVSALTSRGPHRSSKLTSIGRQSAVQFFTQRESSSELEIEGRVQGMSLDGWVEVLVPQGNRRVDDVPEELISGGSLRFGQHVIIKVRATKAPRTKTVYTYHSLISRS
ncbi:MULTISPECIES: hypothetical protein [unclassified Rhodococcus (in: high G+C Gram-positive bacteria)]|uniref:hypothetical protein n=1 Tax=unclassified Rhodococcus (in: high G+C Gram-positive bacteria) TaxID=192944 RepID=UPI001AE8B4F6|nr:MULTISPECIES: hypothetical protein [unclassified Rhodococcus (in: high G+C Gram-positive bacteria)]MBP2523596.1 hypothetical protein [Rhodococcus sp. PvP104]MDA3634728.1 hypothetical protein [Rhodococcus sp. C-2]